MQLDTFQYPLNEQQTQIHIKANRIGKLRPTFNKNSPSRSILNDKPTQDCMHCGRRYTQLPKFHLCQSQQQLESKYGVYGPNSVIYLGFISRIMVFKIICVFIIAVPLLVMNLHGYVCSDPKACIRNDLIYRWSVYNVIGITPGSLPHTCIWLFFCILFICFSIYLRIYVLTTYRRINYRNTTDSDYCLLLRRLPSKTSPQDIKLLIYEEVSRNSTQAGTFSQLVMHSVNNVIMINKQDQRMKEYEASLKKFKKLIKTNQTSNFVAVKQISSTQFAHAAIVRFTDKFAKNKLVQNTQQSIRQKFLNYFCVFYNPKTQYKIFDQQIALQVAPHPTDILWTNFGFSQRNRIIRKVLINTLATLILFISSGVSLGISYLIQTTLSGQYATPFYLTILVVFTTLTFNLLIRRLALHLVKHMRMDTKTDEQSQQLSLIVIHQSLNLGFFSIIAPIIVKLPEFIQKQTIQSSNFPLVMLVTIIVKSIGTNTLNFLLDYFQVMQKIKRFLHYKKLKVRTQTEAYQDFKGLQVPIVGGYSFNIKMVWFGFLYAVVTPISIIISAIGMSLFYLFQRILYNNVYSIPTYSGPRINYQQIDLLDWTPLTIGSFNLFLYLTSQRLRHFQTDPIILAIIFTMMGLGVVHIVLPWKKIIKRFIKKGQDQKNAVFDPHNLQITYQQSNPESRDVPNIIYRQYALDETQAMNDMRNLYINNGFLYKDLRNQNNEMNIGNSKNRNNEQIQSVQIKSNLQVSEHNNGSNERQGYANSERRMFQ